MFYLYVDPVAVSESDPFIEFIVRLSTASVNEVSVHFDQQLATASHAGGTPDYIFQAGTLVFQPGETSRSIFVDQRQDTTAEPVEGFFLDLVNPVNAEVGQRYTPALIFDDDGPTGTAAISVNDVVVDESRASAMFFVSLSRPSASTVTVDYQTFDDTAFAGADYTAIGGTLSFAPGEMVKTVAVALIDDAQPEADEFLSLVLSAPSQATLADDTGIATIGRNDGSQVGAPYVFALPIAASEGEPHLQFTVQLSAPSPNEVSVGYDQQAGSASWAGATPDFNFQQSRLVFAPGETTKTVTLQQLDGTDSEATEVFWLDLFNPENATVRERYTPAWIFDDDGLTGTPAISVNNVVVDESTNSARFFVSLDRPSTSTVRVDFRTDDDTAQAGLDYVAKSGTLSFSPGEMVETVIVDLIDDDIREIDEFFALLLDNPQQATLKDPVGVAIVGANDGPTVGAPYVYALPMAASEGEPQLQFTVQLSAPSSSEVRVGYDQQAGGASWAGATPDFDFQQSTLVFAPGETTKTVTLRQIDGTAMEPTETFWLDLFNPVNATVLERYTPAMIFDDDAPSGTPQISVGDVVVDEGSDFARFHVSLSRPSTTTVSVDYETANDTALADRDYLSHTGTLHFAPGEMVKTVVVDLIDDDTAETDEAFELVLSNPSSATLGDAHGIAVIGRSDSPVSSSPQVFTTPIAVSEGDAQFRFVVQLSSPSQNEVKVGYDQQAGTASWAGTTPDFNFQQSTLVFAPGQTTKTVTLWPIDDTTAESTETFSLDLFNAVNSTIPQRFTPATIVDNDSGEQILSFGLSHDRYTVDAFSDVIVEAPGGGTDTVETALGGYTLPENVENLRMLGNANLLGTGNELNNTFHGNSGNNTFNGGDGFDVVAFGGGVGNYAFTLGASIVAQDLVGTDGTDTLNSIEAGWFPGAGLIEVEDVLNGRDNLTVFVDAGTGQARYTGSAAEREAWRADSGLIELAYPFAIFAPLGGIFSAPGTIPVYRFFDPVGDQYIWTSDEARKDDWLANRAQLWFDGEVTRGHATQAQALAAGGLGLGVNTFERPGAGDVGEFALHTVDNAVALVAQGYVDFGTAFWV